MKSRSSTTIEDIEAGRVDFSDLVTGKKLRAVHPGDVLREDFLAPLGMSQYRLAKETKIPVARVNRILLRKRAVTAETALRLARYFGTGVGFWLNLQGQYDAEIARRRHGRAVAREVRPRTAA